MINPRKTWVGPIRRVKRTTEKKRRSKSPKLKLENVDFILVYDETHLNKKSTTKLETYLSNLRQKGFKIETVKFSLDEDINFVKIYAPRQVLLHFAKIFSIELSFQQVPFKSLVEKPYKFMATPLTEVDINSEVYTRGVHHPRSEITTAEKGLIIDKVLSLNHFGEEKGEIGIKKMLRSNIFESVFPLHDGPFAWSLEGPLNDRQLLTKYWSSVRFWYKQQPLDLIERYYGPETAFYFAWLGFYNKMLIPASITGLLCFFLGAIVFEESFRHRRKEICDSNIFLCPRCIVENCKYSQLKNSCLHAYLVYLFDNPLVVTFAAVMSIWSTVFLELWKREEALLQFRWNLRHVELDYSMRPEFEEESKHKKLSKITGTWEPYMPMKIMCCRYTISGSAILLLVLLAVVVFLSVMVYVKTVNVILTKNAKGEYLTQNVGMIASSSGMIISVVFIISFEPVYRTIALWLTQVENPRTQIDFDNSFTYKSYALAFVSNYSVIFYMAFIKARFYTYPGDEKIWTLLGGLPSDLCDPAGCIMEVATQLVVTLLAKNLLLTATQYIIPQLKIFLTKLTKKKTGKKAVVTLQWESDYLLNPFEKYYYIDEFIQMIIQYGFVTFFVAAFPLAPLLALFNNLIELRVDAMKLTTAYRRPVAFQIANIGAWNGILQGVTYIGVATNAFVIAFTSELVQREIYRTTHSDLAGFVNSTLSIFNVSEFPDTFRSNLNITFCYYPGMRYPPDNPKKYQLTDEFWYQLTIKFLAVVVFEHVVMILTGFIAYAIPDLPLAVREGLQRNEERLKKDRLNKTKEVYLKHNIKQTNDIFAAVK